MGRGGTGLVARIFSMCRKVELHAPSVLFAVPWNKDGSRTVPGNELRSSNLCLSHTGLLTQVFAAPARRPRRIPGYEQAGRGGGRAVE
jgi:hypothetical protein